MLEALISSKVRINLMVRFFLNPEATSYLRSLESEFGGSSNAIRLELNRFEDAGLLSSDSVGKRKLFRANKSHPLFSEIRNLVMKHTGLDKLVEQLIGKIGDLNQVYLAGEIAQGKNSSIIDVVFVGNVDTAYIANVIPKAEKRLNRKIRYLIYSEDEVNSPAFSTSEYLLIWNRND